MSDFLQRLVQRATEPAVVRPRPLGLFEAPGPTVDGLLPAADEAAGSLPEWPLLAPPPTAGPRAAPVAQPTSAAQSPSVAPATPVTHMAPVTRPAALGPATPSAWTVLAPLPRRFASPDRQPEADTPQPAADQLPGSPLPGRPPRSPARSLLAPPLERLLPPDRRPTTGPFATPAPGATRIETSPAAAPAGWDSVAPPVLSPSARPSPTPRLDSPAAPPATHHLPPAALRAIHRFLPSPPPLPSPLPQGEGAMPVAPAPMLPHPPAPQPDSFPALLARLRATLAIEPEQTPARRAAEPPPAPVVHVHIGRVEVRAAPPPPPTRRPRPAPALQTVDDYLRRRNGGAS